MPVSPLGYVQRGIASIMSSARVSDRRQDMATVAPAPDLRLSTQRLLLLTRSANWVSCSAPFSSRTAIARPAAVQGADAKAPMSGMLANNAIDLFL
jgi:hypothetical protein